MFISAFSSTANQNIPTKIMDQQCGSVSQAVLLDSLRKFTTVMPYGLGHTKWEVPNLVSPLMQQGQPTAACISYNLVKDIVTSTDFIASFQMNGTLS